MPPRIYTGMPCLLIDFACLIQRAALIRSQSAACRYYQYLRCLPSPFSRRRRRLIFRRHAYADSRRFAYDAALRLLDFRRLIFRPLRGYDKRTFRFAFRHAAAA